MRGIVYVNLIKQRWSTATRLTLSNAGVIVTCFLLLLVLVTGLTTHYMQAHIEESVDSEMSMLSSEFSIDGRQDLVSHIEERINQRSPHHERVYYYQDRHGKVLAGNISSWPQGLKSNAKHMSIPSEHHPGLTRVNVSTQRFKDGSRLLVGYDEYEQRILQRQLRQGATSTLLLVLILSLLAGRIITRIALRPIETIRRSAVQIMQGDVGHRIPTQNSGDEFDQLATTLNAMLDRMDQLIATVKGATDNIAHDLRSPLTRQRARLEDALRNPPSAEAWEAWIERNLDDLDQVLSTFQSLLKIASVDSGLLRNAFSQFDMVTLCHDAADFMEPLADSREQTLSITMPNTLVINGHRDLLFQMLINLLDNAIKYSPAHSTISLVLSRHNECWQLSVADRGPGIPAAEHEKVFDRLYRLDGARQTPGLGLGLSLVRAIVHLHQGQIELNDAKPGLCLSVRANVA